MHDTGDPWDKSGGTPEFSFPLFSPDRCFSLSEVDQAPGTFVRQKLGEGLANIHAAGVIHRDLHEGNLVSNPDFEVMLIDFDGAQQVEVHPTTMATDFVVPAATMTFDHFRAFLSGYTRGCHLHLADDHPNFVDDLLATIGGTITATPRPALSRLPIPELLTATGLEMGLEGETVRITSTPRLRARTWETRGDEILLLLLGLVLCGIDCSKLFREAAGETPQSPEGQHAQGLFSNLYRRGPVRPPSGAASPARNFVTSALARLQTTIGFPDVNRQPVLGIRQPDHAVATSLIASLAEFAPRSQRDAVLGIVDSLIDVIDYVAALCTASFGPCAQFAQASTMLLDRTTGDARLDEQRALRLRQRHARLHPALTRLGEAPLSGEGNLAIVYAYVQSRCNALVQIFENSVNAAGYESGNEPLWSLWWDSVARMRWILAQLQRHIYAEVRPPTSSAVVSKLLPHALQTHLWILRRHQLAAFPELTRGVASGLVEDAMSPRAFQFHLWSKNARLSREFEWGCQLMERIQSQGLFAAATKALFESGAGYLS
jgi:hypothetical protein